MFAFLRFVTTARTPRSQWKKKDTEEEIRLLVSQTGIQTSIPAHFGHLAKAQAQLASAGAPARDALGTVVKMGNVVTHLTRNQPGTFSDYEWAEAGLLARFWLCLSLLNTVGYCGAPLDRMDADAAGTVAADYGLLTEAGAFVKAYGKSHGAAGKVLNRFRAAAGSARGRGARPPGFPWALYPPGLVGQPESRPHLTWLREFACTCTCANVRSAFSAGSGAVVVRMPRGIQDRIIALGKLRSLILCGP
jgi:hypothetical protein